MPSAITMPQLSDTMTEGTVVKWRKKEGDKVKAGEMIVDIETDKATMETNLRHGHAGRDRGGSEGGKTPVGAADRLAGNGKRKPGGREKAICRRRACRPLQLRLRQPAPKRQPRLRHRRTEPPYGPPPARADQH